VTSEADALAVDVPTQDLHVRGSIGGCVIAERGMRDAPSGRMMRRTLVRLLASSFALGLVLVVQSCSGGLVETIDGGSTCPSGVIRFTFLSTSLGTYCIGEPGTCTNTWLSIHGGSDEIVIDRPCLGDCTTCEPTGCPALCAAPTRMRPGGEERTWDGTIFRTATCGAGLSCVERACAHAGPYIARMCAYRDLSADAPPSICSPAPTPSCTQVPFEWPPSGGFREVVGVLHGDDGDARCCPPSWLMLACTYTDGGVGLNCHNPALKCPSSTACGEGCDFVVAGRCGG
jgi:hypothetical protein